MKPTFSLTIARSRIILQESFRAMQNGFVNQLFQYGTPFMPAHLKKAKSLSEILSQTNNSHVNKYCNLIFKHILKFPAIFR